MRDLIKRKIHAAEMAFRYRAKLRFDDEWTVVSRQKTDRRIVNYHPSLTSEDYRSLSR